MYMNKIPVKKETLLKLFYSEQAINLISYYVFLLTSSIGKDLPWSVFFVPIAQGRWWSSSPGTGCQKLKKGVRRERWWQDRTTSPVPLSPGLWKYYIQGVPEKTLVIVQRPITQVWKQLLGQLGAVFKSSGYQLSFEPKKSRII